MENAQNEYKNWLPAIIKCSGDECKSGRRGGGAGNFHNKTGSCSTDGMPFVVHDCVSDSATVCTDDDGSNPGQRPALSLMRRKATAALGQRRLDLSRSLGRSRPHQSKRGRRPSSCRSQTSRSPSATTWRQRATGPRSDPCSRCPPAQNPLLILQYYAKLHNPMASKRASEAAIFDNCVSSALTPSARQCKLQALLLHDGRSCPVPIPGHDVPHDDFVLGDSGADDSRRRAKERMLLAWLGETTIHAF